MHALYILIGAVSAVLMYRVMRLLGVRNSIACGSRSVSDLSPGCVLFENFPMYEYLVMLMLLATALALHRLLSQPDWRSSLLLFGCLAILCYLRNLFPLQLLALLLAGLAWYLRRARWQIVAADCCRCFWF